MTIVHIWSFRIWCMTKEFSKKEKRPIKFKTTQKDKNFYGLIANFTPPNSILSLILSMNFSQSQEVHKTLSFQLKRSYFFQNIFFWYLWWLRSRYLVWDNMMYVWHSRYLVQKGPKQYDVIYHQSLTLINFPLRSQGTNGACCFQKKLYLR